MVKANIVRPTEMYTQLTVVQEDGEAFISLVGKGW